MYGSKEYRMAKALLMFNQAFKELAAASKALPDLDVRRFSPDLRNKRLETPRVFIKKRMVNK